MLKSNLSTPRSALDHLSLTLSSSALLIAAVVAPQMDLPVNVKTAFAVSALLTFCAGVMGLISMSRKARAA